MNTSTAALLSIHDLRVSFGGIEAVKGIDLDIAAGELVTLIGANGAGKTTTLKAITNTLAASHATGEISYLGQRIDHLPAHKLPGLGLVMVPEGRGVFSRMTIRENLLMGAYMRDDQLAIDADIDYWFGIFPRLKERENQLAGNLSGGEQQMLAMARALMSHPKLLLLDEPSAGLAPVIVQSIFELMRRIRNEGYTVLIVEQNIQQVLKVVDRGYLIETGKIRASGTASELLNSDEVQKAYLGV
jgi:branched-chain amino acid transport system ATP-binding protein